MILKSHWIKNISDFVKIGLSGYSNIFFMSSPVLGAVILVLSFRYPSVGIHGLVAEVLSLVYWGWHGRKSLSPEKVAPPFNAILCGTFLGYWMTPGIKSFILLIAVWYTNLIFHSVLDSVLGKSRLPVLSLPFSLTCLILGPIIQSQAPLASVSKVDGFLTLLDHWSSGWVFLDQVFQSLGSVIFLPFNGVGAILLVSILIYSRFLFLGVVGSLGFSYAIHSFIYPVGIDGVVPVGFFNWSHFNFALIGAAIGGAFFIPGRASIFGMFASFWSCMISYYGLLYFFQYRVEMIHSFPLCVGTMVGVYLSRKSHPQSINHSLVRPIEKALAYLRLKKRRFGDVYYSLELPLAEPAHILQSFSGPWTHQGKWKEALDFVCRDETGRSFQGTGQKVNDYFIYGKTVIAPIAGWVVNTEDLSEDSVIGKLSFHGNWGNWILLKSTFGFYVLLAHLKKKSIKVKVGSYVEVGQALAEVGNSGYSGEPHLHIQVQETTDLKAGTVPFNLRCYSNASGEVLFYKLPEMGASVIPVRGNQTLQWSLNFGSGQDIYFEADGREIHFRSSLDPKTGLWFFEDIATSAKAYFWKDEREFYFYDWKNVGYDSDLNIFSLILGRVPFALGQNIHWKDFVSSQRLPSSLVSGVDRILVSSQMLESNTEVTPVNFEIASDGTSIRGSLQFRTKRLAFEVRLDPWVGIRSVLVGGRRWDRRVGNSNVKAIEDVEQLRGIAV